MSNGLIDGRNGDVIKVKLVKIDRKVNGNGANVEHTVVQVEQGAKNEFGAWMSWQKLGGCGAEIPVGMKGW